MNDVELLALAKDAGFAAAIAAPEQVPVDEKFRVYCEENLCGKYGANYSCPPDCGEVAEMRRRILAEEKVLVLQTVHPIDGYGNKPEIHQSREAHNAMVLGLMAAMQNRGLVGFCSGYNGCPLCSPCKRVVNEPCAYPDRRISCMSAYCVDVAKLAEICGLEFSWSEENLYLFGMIAFHEQR